MKKADVVRFVGAYPIVKETREDEFNEKIDERAVDADDRETNDFPEKAIFVFHIWIRKEGMEVPVSVGTYPLFRRFFLVDLRGRDAAFTRALRVVEKDGSVLVGAQGLAIILRLFLRIEQFDDGVASLDLQGPLAVLFTLCNVINLSSFFLRFCHGVSPCFDILFYSFFQFYVTYLFPWVVKKRIGR